MLGIEAVEDSLVANVLRNEALFVARAVTTVLFTVLLPCIKMTASWQQALALDARYNAYRAPNNPQFREYQRFVNLQNGYPCRKWACHYLAQ